VLAELAEHVIEEWDTGINRDCTSSIKIEFYKNAGLFGGALNS
jgi:hypothetical protein